MGIGRSFQRTNIFPRLSVFDNVQIAVLAHLKRTLNMMTPARSLVRDETLAVAGGRPGSPPRSSRPAAPCLTACKSSSSSALRSRASRRCCCSTSRPPACRRRRPPSAIALVGRIVRERGLTLLFTEHDMDVVFSIAERHHRAAPGRRPGRGHARGGAAVTRTCRRHLPGRGGMKTLEVSDLSRRSYGLSQILFGVSLSVETGECVALLRPQRGRQDDDAARRSWG